MLSELSESMIAEVFDSQISNSIIASDSKENRLSKCLTAKCKMFRLLHHKWRFQAINAHPEFEDFHSLMNQKG
jgi:hypothetical protein